MSPANKKSAKKACKKPNPGLSLETAMTRIQQMLDPNSSVTHNEALRDLLGNKRQFDVVIRGTFGGHAVLGVVECKDHNRKKNPDAVEAFATKCKNLGADLKIMVSRLGFTKKALVVAKQENIRCLSLLPGDYGKTGFSLKVICYSRIWSWANINFSLVPEFPEIMNYTSNDFLMGGKPILELFDRDLEANFPTYTSLGPVRRAVDFGRPLTLDVKGRGVMATTIRFRADRICTHKRKEIEYFGDGIYDWQKSDWKIPDKGSVFTEAWEGDFSEWEDIPAPIPTVSNNPFRWVVDLFIPPRVPLSYFAQYEFRIHRPPAARLLSEVVNCREEHI